MGRRALGSAIGVGSWSDASCTLDRRNSNPGWTAVVPDLPPCAFWFFGMWLLEAVAPGRHVQWAGASSVCIEDADTVFCNEGVFLME